jgi:hypothetical protein
MRMSVMTGLYVKLFTFSFETAVMGIDEISPEIEPINVKGGAYVN